MLLTIAFLFWFQGGALQDSINTLNARASAKIYVSPDSTILYASKALKLAEAGKDAGGKARALLNLGKGYYIKGNYDTSLKYALQANKAGKAAGDEKVLAASLNSIGLIFLAQHKYERALEEFKRSIAISSKLKDFKMLATSNFNVGLCYDELRRPEEAIHYLKESIRLATITSDWQIRAMAFNRMGETQFHMGNYAEARRYYSRVINDKSFQSDWENSFAHSGIAQSALKQGDRTTAIRHGLEGLRYARIVNAKWDIERSLKILSEAYKSAGDYESAYRYLELDKLYSDSLYSDAKEAEMNAMHLKQQQLQNSLLAEQNRANIQRLQLSNRNLLITGALSLLLLAATVVIYYYFRQRSRLSETLKKRNSEIAARNQLIMQQKDELEKVNQTQDQLFSILGHDLRGPFASIVQALDMIRDGTIPRDEMHVFLNDFHEKMIQTASMVENLVVWAESQRRGIKAAPTVVDLKSLVDQTLMLLSFMIGDKNIRVEHHIQGAEDIFADADHVSVIVHNLLGNAIKFTPVGGLVEVSYRSCPEFISMQIRDSGVGMSDEKINRIFNVVGKEVSSYGTKKEKGLGLGLKLVQNFAERNHAKLEVNSVPGEGTIFTVHFKRPPAGAVKKKRGADELPAEMGS